jgi:hypothetical protein
MIEHTHEAPPISMMEFKRLLKVMEKKYAELDALVKSPDRRTPARVEKMRRLIGEIDETIWRAQLDYQPLGKQCRAQLAELEAALNGSNN